LALWLKDGKWSAPEQSPTAGRGEGIHAGLVAGDADASGWDAAARRHEARGNQCWRQFTEVCESRNET